MLKIVTKTARTSSILLKLALEYSKLPASIRRQGSSLTLTVQAKPNSKQTKLLHIDDSYLKIAVKALP